MAKGGHNKGRPDLTDEDYVAKWKANCVVTATQCWEWQGWRHRQDGPSQLPYAEASYCGKAVRLHRKMLEIALGRPLRLGMQACHTCDNPPCINPDHVFEASCRQNHLDMVAKKRHTKQKRTHCLRYGHPLSGDNLHIRNDGRRVCKLCQTIRQRLEAGWTLEEATTLPPTPPGAITPRRDFRKGKHRRLTALSTGESP